MLIIEWFIGIIRFDTYYDGGMVFTKIIYIYFSYMMVFFTVNYTHGQTKKSALIKLRRNKPYIYF